MPSITASYERSSKEPPGDAFDKVRALLEEEKQKPQYRGVSFSSSPEWREAGRTITAKLPYKVPPNFSAVTPVEPEPEPVKEPAAEKKSLFRKHSKQVSD